MQKLGDLVAGFFFLCLGIWACIGGVRLHVGDLSVPQAGFFPFLGGAILTVLSAIQLFQVSSGRNTGSEGFGTLWRPVAMIAGLIVYVAMLNSAGYIIATFVLSVILLRVLDARRWWVVGVVALVISLGSYILFDTLLGEMLPRGILSKFL